MEWVLSWIEMDSGDDASPNYLIRCGILFPYKRRRSVCSTNINESALIARPWHIVPPSLRIFVQFDGPFVLNSQIFTRMRHKQPLVKIPQKTNTYIHSHPRQCDNATYTLNGVRLVGRGPSRCQWLRMILSMCQHICSSSVRFSSKPSAHYYSALVEALQPEGRHRQTLENHSCSWQHYLQYRSQ